MVFSSTIFENNTSPFEQGKKFLFGAQAPFMASNNSPAAAAATTTSSAAAAAYTHAIFEQQQPQQPQQQSFQHHHHQQQQPQQRNDDENNNHHQISFGMIPSASSSSAAIHSNFLNIKDGGGAYDLGELDQALFLYLDSQEQSTAQEQRQNCGMRPHTLNIFPSQPMHVEPSSSTPAAATRASTGTVSPATSGSKRSSEPSMELSNPRNDAPQPAKAVKREGNRKGATSNAEQEGPKTPDPKALRRLAQNREAARKSRLRKKAYVQQLESSRIRLTQLEQEIQRARSQGIFLGGGSVLGGEQGQVPLAMGNINSDAAVFDMEYARWVDEHQRLMVELRNAVQDHLPENELRIYVGNCLAHYDQLMNLKSMIIKSDVFHIFSSMWKTPAECCFMWIGGFRPSEIIKVISSQVEPLTEQQLMGICGLQQSTHEAEEALSQGLEALNQSLNEILISDPLNLPPDVNAFMSTMALAINKLSTLEGFVRQADHLRHQTLHRLHQLLTTRQSARCFLAMAEYFHRLRALSSLWLARPRQD